VDCGDRATAGWVLPGDDVRGNANGTRPDHDQSMRGGGRGRCPGADRAAADLERRLVPPTQATGAAAGEQDRVVLRLGHYRTTGNRMRSGAEYTLHRRPRRKPTNVIPNSFGQFDRQAGRRRHRGEHRNPRDRCLLRNLEPSPATDDQYIFRKRQQAVE